MEKIFDRAVSGLRRTHVDALFLSLVAAEMLSLKSVRGVFKWNLTWLDEHTPAYTRNENWKGINVFDALRPRKRTPEKIAAAVRGASVRKAAREATAATGGGLSNDGTSNSKECQLSNEDRESDSDSPSSQLTTEDVRAEDDMRLDYS